MEQGLDVEPCLVMVLVYNEDLARPRTIGPQRIARSTEGLIDALDAGVTGCREPLYVALIGYDYQ